METELTTADPWRIEIITVRDHSHSATERSALHRDERRGLFRRLSRGAHVERSAFDAMSPEDQHVVRMRALSAVSDAPVTFSHWSAAVLHGLPVLRSRLARLHTTVDDAASRSGAEVSGHVFPLSDREVVDFRGLRATGVGRTVVDVAGAAPFEEGVMAADGALRAGVPRALLEMSVELVGARRALRRMTEVVAFGHPGAESAAETRFRVTASRMGLEVPRLQHRIRLVNGSDIHIDALLPSAQVGVEVDGDRKYLDPEMAPEGAAQAVLAEKRREDEMRTHLRGLVRIGWTQSGSASLLRPLLARVGVGPTTPRTGRAEYAAAAASAEPRFGARIIRWRA